MIKALVIYKELIDGGHPLLDDYWVEKSKIIEVEKETDINKVSNHIVNIKIL